MKSIASFTGLTLLLFMGSQIIGAGSNLSAQTAEKTTVESKAQTVKIKVIGMTCAGCANHISGALGKLEGVLEKQVLFPGDMATVKYDPAQTNEKEILKAIDDTGYKASIVKEKEQEEKKRVDN
jgi:periplasmic mercuric ion binding protein